MYLSIDVVINLLIQIALVVLTLIGVFLKFRADLRKYYQNETEERLEITNSIMEIKSKVGQFEIKICKIEEDFRTQSKEIQSQMSQMTSANSGRDVQIVKLAELISGKFELLNYSLNQIKEDLSQLRDDFLLHLNTHLEEKK